MLESESESEKSYQSRLLRDDASLNVIHQKDSSVSLSKFSGDSNEKK